MCLPVASTPVAEIGSLEAADVGRAELGGEVRVLAVGLLDPAPARVARDVEDRARGRGAPRSPASAGGSCRPRLPTRSGSNVAAAPIDCWKHGASSASRPWRHSSWMIAGIPRRVSSTRKRWIALAARATSRARRLVEPARRVIWPMPSPASARSRSGSGPSLADDLECPDGAQLGDLLVAGHPGDEVGHACRRGQAGVAVGRRRGRHPFTDPCVRPPTSWRSAKR